jgi:hypothetical protein
MRYSVSFIKMAVFARAMAWPFLREAGGIPWLTLKRHNRKGAGRSRHLLWRKSEFRYRRALNTALPLVLCDSICRTETMSHCTSPSATNGLWKVGVDWGIG